ncbi:MAG: FAD-dependent oxidoreductase, partial [Thermoanaerobaculia bacterium]
MGLRSERSKPRLLVLGSGFAGFSLLSRLRRGLFDATLLSPRNYFLFTPLLPSAVAGTVEFRSILEPVRRRRRDVRVIEGRAEGVEWEARQVRCVSAVGEERFVLPYDLLAIAVGAAVGDHGVPGAREHALTLASVEDARAIRRGVLDQFARADV